MKIPIKPGQLWLAEFNNVNIIIILILRIESSSSCVILDSNGVLSRKFPINFLIQDVNLSHRNPYLFNHIASVAASNESE